MKYIYYRLLDVNNKGAIIRTNGPNQHTYVPGKGWVRSAILTQYFCDESDYYDLYEEISEAEATTFIEETSSK